LLSARHHRPFALSHLEGTPVSLASLRPLQIRQVAYTDPLVLPMLAELDYEYDTRYGHKLGDLAVETQRRAAEFGPPDGGVVLVLDGGLAVTGGAFRRFDEHTAELKRIWTRATHRRRGLARLLLAELERVIAELGYTGVYLTTGPRQPEAKALYLATNYRPLYDQSLDPESIGKHAFEKALPAAVAAEGNRP
jgi:GNAT superfamily N-acetyltransferase